MIVLLVGALTTILNFGAVKRREMLRFLEDQFEHSDIEIAKCSVTMNTLDPRAFGVAREIVEELAAQDAFAVRLT